MDFRRHRPPDEHGDMPKPRKVENQVRAWISGQQDSGLVAWCRLRSGVAIHTAPGSNRTNAWSVGSPGDAKAAMGFAGRESSTIFDTSYAYVLTESRFLVLELSGLKERVKQLWVHSPARGLILHYADVPAEHGVFRHVALELPEGRLGPNDKPANFVHDSVRYTTKKGTRSPFADSSDSFVAAFGENAVCHTPSQ